MIKFGWAAASAVVMGDRSMPLTPPRFYAGNVFIPYCGKLTHTHYIPWQVVESKEIMKVGNNDEDRLPMLG